MQWQPFFLRNAVAGAALCGGHKQRRQIARRQHGRKRGLDVGSTTHLIRCVDSSKVGVEQQLHHIERRALGESVVQRKLLALSIRGVRRSIGRAGQNKSVREEKGEGGHVDLPRQRGQCICAELRALSGAAAASRLASSSSSVTSKEAPLVAAWCKGSFPSCEAPCVAQHRARETRSRRSRAAAAQQRQRGRRYVGFAARLGHNGGSLAVGVEQQLHHIERLAHGGSVVQGQLSLLYIRGTRRSTLEFVH